MRCEENRPVHDMIIHSIFFGNQQQSQPSTDLDLGGKPVLNRKRDDLRAMRHIRATISLREWNTSPLVRHSYTRITFPALFFLHLHSLITMPPASSKSRTGRGICAMRDTCGRTSMFGADLPCPDDNDATVVSTRIDYAEPLFNPITDTLFSPIKIS